MSQYLSIGKVSKLKNVSIKSLRYYDKIGILKPAFVNTETNYRYYTEEQLYLLDAITLCIKLGIPLKDLNSYVEHDSINLQKLLYDGKALAEEKIMEIHQCLESLQETLQQLSTSVSGMAKSPPS
ncbi:MAG: MerR family transcriptional regulator, partial [Lachnospiraceae bacterium]|nr:MerR family transcriptional regulator [Lachnospiraceae bacterium]